MNLGEALLLRSDLQKKMSSLRSRIASNALVQEGNTPLEEPAALLAEAMAVGEQLEGLIVTINAANLACRLPDGRTMTAAIAHRDMLTQRHVLLQAAVEGAKKDPELYSAREIKWVATLDVRSLQKQSDDIARQIRELNVHIQETNWKTPVGMV